MECMFKNTPAIYMHSECYYMYNFIKISPCADVVHEEKS